MYIIKMYIFGFIFVSATYQMVLRSCLVREDDLEVPE